jgi:predicted Rdx family selenoprotein
LEAVIKKQFDVEATLKERIGGIYEVALNERVIFSNPEEGPFPENEEIFQKIREQMESA